MNTSAAHQSLARLLNKAMQNKDFHTKYMHHVFTRKKAVTTEWLFRHLKAALGEEAIRQEMAIIKQSKTETFE